MTRLCRPGFVFFCAAFAVAADMAMAQGNPGGATFRGMTANVGENFAGAARIIPMLCYVIGVFFAASGLLKLKDWINEGDKIGILPALMRLIVSALLITLPHILVITTGTLFGNQSDGGVEVKVPAPRLGAFEKTGH
jgi:hypothetical protein